MLPLVALFATTDGRVVTCSGLHGVYGLGVRCQILRFRRWGSGWADMHDLGLQLCRPGVRCSTGKTKRVVVTMKRRHTFASLQ